MSVSIAEDCLQEAWGAMVFQREGLQCSEGAPVVILHPGRLNRGQGPDFQEGKILLDGQLLFGWIEIHVEGRDWYRHGHDRDPLYNGVILHVCLEASPVPPLRADGSRIPELVLREHLYPGWQERFQALRSSRERVACGGFPLKGAKIEMVHQGAEERIQSKVLAVETLIRRCGGDWDQSMRVALGASIAGPVNAESFRDLLMSTEARLFKKCGSNPLRLEALLLGRAGLLSQKICRSGYPERLYREWAYLRDAFGLRPALLPLRQLGMRPAGQPLRRLLDLASLLARFPQPVALLGPEGGEHILSKPLPLSPYWQDHVAIGQLGKRRFCGAGRTLRERLLLNVVIPFSLAYARLHGRAHSETILDLARDLAPERNRIVRLMESQGFTFQNGYETQGGIQLYREYCRERRCLSCKVGRQILGEELSVPVH